MMIVDNVAVTPVCALCRTAVCAGHVSQLSIILLLFINYFKLNTGTPMQG